MMQEITVYRIVWKNLLAAIVCLAFAVGSIVMICQGKGNASAASGGMLFFGIGGLFLLYQTWRVRRRPYLTITDKCLIQSRAESFLEDYEVPFSAVDHFELSKFYLLLPLNRELRVYYKTDKDKQKVYSPTILGRIANWLFSVPKDYIDVDGINMKPQELCDLLNNTLIRSRQSQHS